jgi:hypothetical protein
MLKAIGMGMVMYLAMGATKYVCLCTTPASPAYNEFRIRIDGLAPQRVDVHTRFIDLYQAAKWLAYPFEPSFRGHQEYAPELDDLMREIDHVMRSMGI